MLWSKDVIIGVSIFVSLSLVFLTTPTKRLISVAFLMLWSSWIWIRGWKPPSSYSNFSPRRELLSVIAIPNTTFQPLNIFKILKMFHHNYSFIPYLSWDALTANSSCIICTLVYSFLLIFPSNWCQQPSAR